MNNRKRFDLWITSGFTFLILLIIGISLFGIFGLEKVKAVIWLTVAAVVLAVALSLYIWRRLMKIQSQLHEEKEMLQITFDSIGDGVITTDTNRNVMNLNKVAEEFTGWKTREAFGKPFTQVFDITNTYTGKRAKDPVEEVLATDKTCLLENHTILTSKDGTKRHIADSAAPIKDENGVTSGVVMIFRDVTERKRAERLLKESEEKFRTIFEQSPIGIGLRDPETGQIIDVNERFAQILGRETAELKAIDWISIMHPEDVQNEIDQMALLNSGKIPSYHLEKRFIKPDGSYAWIHTYVTLLSHSNRDYPLQLCMVEDITQQKTAEHELKISESRLRTAQSMADVGNWELELQTNTMWASEQAFKIYGIKQESPYLSLKAAQEIVRPEDRPTMDEALRLLLAENKPYDVQYIIYRADNHQIRVVHSYAVAERGVDGKPVKVVGTIQDITKLKNAELALAQSNTRLQTTLQSTAEGIEALDMDGNLIFYNEQFRKMWGLPEGADQNVTFSHITDRLNNPNTSLGDVRGLVMQVGDEPFRELSLKDGRTFERYANPILVDGAMTGYVLSYRDVSGRKRAQRALLDSEARHKAMIAYISDTIAIIDENRRMTYVSPNLEHWFGWKEEDFKDQGLSGFVHPDDLEKIRDDYFHLAKSDGMKRTFEFRLRCRNERYKFIQLTAVNMLSDPNIRGILMNFHDISDSKRREREILYLNYHDLLTGLYNRAFFEEECSRLDCERQLPISVIMGDINGLKLINDAFGHKEGDKLLVKIAEILKKSCRKEDILARTGGDEFCILLPKTTPEQARTITKRILSDCKEYESKTDKETLYYSISLGYATKTDIDVPVESLLTEAEEYMYKQKLLERKSMRSSLISSIKTTMNEKSHLTAEHEERLVALSKLIGRALDLSDVQTNELELLSTLHDIGKLSINDQILNKPGKLTDEEWLEIRKHPDIGYRIAQASPELMPIADYILCHHERWDGKGYPQGLKGESIPLLSRIVSVVDAFDAMTQDRPYRKAMPEADAINEILGNAGSQFDPEIAKIFVDAIARQ